jgi:antitoxin YefM
MLAVPLTKAQKNLSELFNQTIESRSPLIITGGENNVIMISEKNWRSIEETLYLNSIPGLAQSIKKSMDSPISEFVGEEELEW